MCWNRPTLAQKPDALPPEPEASHHRGARPAPGDGGHERVYWCASLQMNAVRGSPATWRPQPWQDGDWGGGGPLSDSDSEEEDFPDDSTTPLGNYVLHGEAAVRDCGAPPTPTPPGSGLTCWF